MSSSEQKLIYSIALTMIPGVGSILAKNLLSYCGSAEAVFNEKSKALKKIPDIGRITANNIRKKDALENAEKELGFIERNGVRALFFTDSDYPRRLKNCIDGPVIIYTKGNVDLNLDHMIAVVGTRAATEYGKRFCDNFIKGVAEINGTIVSGLAYGIDITAHRAALNNNVKTVAVLGHGLDRIYPALHAKVARQIAETGMLISEFPSGTIPDRENFPKRNRIIAGLCDATVVVEAGIKGGALITAGIADSYNRDVFAVPGRFDDAMSSGTNLLIRNNTAALIENHQDLIRYMMWDDAALKKDKNIQTIIFPELSNEEKTLVSLLSEKRELHIDRIALECSMKISRVAAVLLELEFKGVVAALPGKRFKLNY